MKQMIEKFYCDNCEKEMSKFDYEKSVKIDLTVNLPHPEGMAGQTNGINMVICKECSNRLGIVNSNEFHNYIYSRQKLKGVIIKTKSKILNMAFNKGE